MKTKHSLSLLIPTMANESSLEGNEMNVEEIGRSMQEVERHFVGWLELPKLLGMCFWDSQDAGDSCQLELNML